jgi:hypothetical protein
MVAPILVSLARKTGCLPCTPSKYVRKQATLLALHCTQWLNSRRIYLYHSKQEGTSCIFFNRPGWMTEKVRRVGLPRLQQLCPRIFIYTATLVDALTRIHSLTRTRTHTKAHLRQPTQH